MLSQKKILLISPQAWDHLYVSKHHYAIHLAARNNKVFFLNPPAGHDAVEGTAYKGLWSVKYHGFPKGLRRYPPVLQRYFFRKNFKKLEKLCGVTFDLIWSFDNSVFYDFQALPKRLYKICHTVDFNQNFQTKKATKTADICFCTSEAIKQRMIAFNLKTFKINHGFSPVKNYGRATIPGNNAIKCFYAGNLDIPYLDWHLIETLVSRYPHADFIFAGNWEEKSNRMTSLMAKDNFFYLGTIEASNLVAYYLSSHILLVCYLHEQYLDQLSNPHKMMEYLASGKIIIATWTEEYRAHNERLLLMSKTTDEFCANFEKVLYNLEYWNSENLARDRKSYALENTYQKQVERIEGLIEGHVSK